MNKNLKWLFLIPFSLVLLVVSIISIGYSSWIITGSSTIASNEITGFKDSNLDSYALKYNFTYNRYAQFPYAELGNTVIKEIEEKYEVKFYSKNDEGLLTEVNETKNAGTYIVEFYNRESHIVTRKEYIINKCDLIVNIPTFTSIFYSKNITIDESKFSVEGVNGDPISGKFSFSVTDEIINEGSNVDSHSLIVNYNYTISSFNKDNYNIVSGNFGIPLKSVAKIGSAYYSRVENALLTAAETSGSQIVEIIPGLSATIFENCEIPGGDTLLVSFSDNAEIPTNTNGTFSAYAINAYAPTTQLTISKDISLNNNGSLIINGVVSGGNGGHISSYTSGSYAQINVLNGAVIQSNRGSSITCYGYIVCKDASKDQVIINNESSLTLPFIVDEHRGGSLFLSMAGGISALWNPQFETSPFNRFHFNNIHGNLKVESNGKIIGRVNLYAGGQNNITTLNIVGPKGSTAYMLSLNEGSYLKINYNHSSEKIKLDVYGGGELNSLSLSITASGMRVNLTTSGMLFPISWYYDISLNSINGQAATFDLTKQDVKLLPGSSLTINENVTVNANTISAYKSSQFYDTVATQNYPTGLNDARITLNGTLNVQNIGGKIYNTNASNETNLIVSSTSVESNELMNNEPKYYKVTTNLELPTYKDSTFNVEIINEAGVYGVNQNYYSNEKSYCWEQYLDYSKYTITFIIPDDAINLGSETKSIYVVPKDSVYTITSSILPDDSQFKYAGKQLSGWITNDGTSALGYEITGDITLYAEWETREYDINYIFYKVESGEKIMYSNEEGFVLNNPNTINTFTADLTSPISLNPANASLNGTPLKFSGWFLDIGNNKTIKLNSISKEIIAEYEEILEENDGLNIYCILEESSYYLVQYYNQYDELHASYIVEENTSHALISQLPDYQTNADNNRAGSIPYQWRSWVINNSDVSNSINVSSDINIYAGYNKITYKITINKGWDNVVVSDSAGNNLSNGDEIYLGETLNITNNSTSEYKATSINGATITIPKRTGGFLGIGSTPGTGTIEVKGNVTVSK